jgi:hypothetical protein
VVEEADLLTMDEEVEDVVVVLGEEVEDDQIITIAAITAPAETGVSIRNCIIITTNLSNSSR